MKLKQTIFKTLNSFFNKKGYSLMPNKSINSINNHYTNFTQNIILNNNIISFVFSKDRAIQLNAFLESYFENITNFSQMVILYKASDLNHKKSYEELKRIYKKLPVVFVEEINFRKQLINILSNFSEDKIIFYVDDMIFTHKFDYDKLEGINPYENIVSLSRGADLTYSSVLLKKLKVPTFLKIDGLLKFSWNEINEFSDWTYPLGVSGYMFATKEILSIIENIDFKAPNSLEGNMQVFLPLFKDRIGICTKNAISICVHANLVQTEGLNPTLGEFSIEDLLNRWNKGSKIDVSKFYNKKITIAQDQNYTFKQR
jgi:hypothetical protein